MNLRDILRGGNRADPNRQNIRNDTRGVINVPKVDVTGMRLELEKDFDRLYTETGIRVTLLVDTAYYKGRSFAKVCFNPKSAKILGEVQNEIELVLKRQGYEILYENPPAQLQPTA